MYQTYQTAQYSIINGDLQYQMALSTKPFPGRPGGRLSSVGLLLPSQRKIYTSGKLQKNGEGEGGIDDKGVKRDEWQGWEWTDDRVGEERKKNTQI